MHGLKLIEHPHPLMLISSDLLSGGRQKGCLNFTWTRLVTHDDCTVSGRLCFARREEQMELHLVNVPHVRGSHCAGIDTVGYVGAPALGGQRLWRYT